MCALSLLPTFFFFNDTATTEIYTLSLHDALPICPQTHKVLRLGGKRDGGGGIAGGGRGDQIAQADLREHARADPADRKSTRLNSSHQIISYAVFCFKKKKISKPPAYTTAHYTQTS